MRQLGPSSAPAIDPQMLPNAFCSFTGATGVALGVPYGIASITRNSAGDYTIVYQTPFRNTDYQVHGLAQETAALTGFMVAIKQSTALATTSVTINCGNSAGTPSDPAVVYFAAFGD